VALRPGGGTAQGAGGTAARYPRRPCQTPARCGRPLSPRRCELRERRSAAASRGAPRKSSGLGARRGGRGRRGGQRPPAGGGTGSAFPAGPGRSPQEARAAAGTWPPCPPRLAPSLPRGGAPPPPPRPAPPPAYKLRRAPRGGPHGLAAGGARVSGRCSPARLRQREASAARLQPRRHLPGASPEFPVTSTLPAHVSACSDPSRVSSTVSSVDAVSALFSRNSSQKYPSYGFKSKREIQVKIDVK